MAVQAISLTVFLYAITGVSCIKTKDYPHALMWFAYSFANLGLLWYELKKNK